MLSIGIVAATQPPLEFYAEVSDAQRVSAAGAFAREAVLPQFGKRPGAACTYAELGRRLVDYLSKLTSLCARGEVIAVVFESDRDWTLVQRAIVDAAVPASPRIVARLRPVNEYNMPGFAAGTVAAADYFASQQGTALSRHHALCDARALQIAYRAANAAHAADASHAEPTDPPALNRLTQISAG